MYLTLEEIWWLSKINLIKDWNTKWGLKKFEGKEWGNGKTGWRWFDKDFRFVIKNYNDIYVERWGYIKITIYWIIICMCKWECWWVDRWE